MRINTKADIQKHFSKVTPYPVSIFEQPLDRYGEYRLVYVSNNNGRRYAVKHVGHFVTDPERYFEGNAVHRAATLSKISGRYVIITGSGGRYYAYEVDPVDTDLLMMWAPCR